MTTKAIILERILNTNTYYVRVPYLETSGIKEGRQIATLSCEPSISESYMPGDVVMVTFEDHKPDKPIIMGRLYVDDLGARGSANFESLSVKSKVILPEDVKVGNKDLMQLLNKVENNPISNNDSGVSPSPTGDVNWGSIGGTLSNQTDLQNALNTKQAVIDANTDLTAHDISAREFVASGCLGINATTNLIGFYTNNIIRTVTSPTPAIYTYTYPNASGTIATQEWAASQCIPRSGNAANVDLGNYNLKTGSLLVKDTNNTMFLGISENNIYVYDTTQDPDNPIGYLIIPTDVDQNGDTAATQYWVNSNYVSLASGGDCEGDIKRLQPQNIIGDAYSGLSVENIESNHYSGILELADYSGTKTTIYPDGIKKLGSSYKLSFPAISQDETIATQSFVIGAKNAILREVSNYFFPAHSSTPVQVPVSDIPIDTLIDIVNNALTLVRVSTSNGEVSRTRYTITNAYIHYTNNVVDRIDLNYEFSRATEDVYCHYVLYKEAYELVWDSSINGGYSTITTIEIDNQ